MKGKINNKNIVFWGGKAACGTTSNLAALASYMAYFHGYRMRLCQTEGTTLRTYFTESALEVTQRKGMFLRNTGSIDEQRKMTFIDCGRRTDEWTRQIMKKADLKRFICEKYSKACFQIRNEWMVNHSSCVIAVYNGETGGTRNTIAYANKNKVEVLNVLEG